MVVMRCLMLFLLLSLLSCGTPKHQNIDPPSWKTLLHEGLVHSVAFSPCGRYLASSSSEGIIRIWDAVSGREVRRIRTWGLRYSCAIAFSPDGKTFAYQNEKHVLALADVSSGWSTRPLSGERGVLDAMEFSRDGKLLACAFGGQERRMWDVEVWDVDSRKLRQRIKGPKHGSMGLSGVEAVVSISFSPEGETIALGFGEKVEMLDVETGRKAILGEPPVVSGGAAFFPKENKLAVQHSGNTVAVFDAAERKELYRLSYGSTFSTQLEPVAVSPNGRYVAAGEAGGPLHVWDVSSKTLCAQGRHEGTVTALAFSPDSKTLISASEDCTVRAWHIPQEKK